LKVERGILVRSSERYRNNRQPVAQPDRPELGLWPLLHTAYQYRVAAIRSVLVRHRVATAQQVDRNEMRLALQDELAFGEILGPILAALFLVCGAQKLDDRHELTREAVTDLQVGFPGLLPFGNADPRR